MDQSTVIRIGFDLDGVLLYNPVRIFRPIISWIKRVLLHKRKTKFFVPQGKFMESLFILFHKSSLFAAPGYDQLFALAKVPKVELYLITARFGFLKHDLETWEDKLQATKLFKNIYFNELNEQPHLFKQRMVEELKLAVFVEDNWDIVQFLNSECKRAKILWIYNLFDAKIEYQLKFPDLVKVMSWIRQELKLP